MSTENTKIVRIQHTHDKEENWSNKPSFIPLAGEIICFDVDGTYAVERYKIGDGVHTLAELPFRTNIGNDGDGISSEVFNDYINNKARTPYSHASGYATVAGGAAFQISSVNPNTGYVEEVTTTIEITLDSVDGISVGDVCSARISSNFIDFGKVTSISGNTLTLDNYPKDLTAAVINKTIVGQTPSETSLPCYLWIGTKQDIGTVFLDEGQHAEGCSTVSIGYAAHAEGYSSIASGRYSHAEGFNSYAGFAAHAEGYQGKATGENSHAEGRVTKASGHSSHAEGQNTASKGNRSHAEGHYTDANGEGSHAEGYRTAANGNYAHAENSYTSASGEGSHAEGDYTQANGAYSHAEGGRYTNGKKTYATGDYSHAEGRATNATGLGSHTEGASTTASGENSHAEGLATTASGTSSHAEGHYATASGQGSHAEGNSTSSGKFSHSEGKRSSSSGEASHAEGSETVASNFASHAEGQGTVTAKLSQHVQGKWNKSDANMSHIVGGGSGEEDRKNIHTLDWHGNAWFAESVTVGETKNLLATKDYVDDQLSKLSGNIVLNKELKCSHDTSIKIPENALPVASVNYLKCFSTIANKNILKFPETLYTDPKGGTVRYSESENCLIFDGTFGDSFSLDGDFGTANNTKNLPMHIAHISGTVDADVLFMPTVNAAAICVFNMRENSEMTTTLYDPTGMDYGVVISYLSFSTEYPYPSVINFNNYRLQFEVFREKLVNNAPQKIVSKSSGGEVIQEILLNISNSTLNISDWGAGIDEKNCNYIKFDDDETFYIRHCYQRDYIDNDEKTDCLTDGVTTIDTVDVSYNIVDLAYDGLINVAPEGEVSAVSSDNVKCPVSLSIQVKPVIM